MRFRWVMLMPFLMLLGCQDKKPEGAAPSSELSTTAEATTTPSLPSKPLEGAIEGKAFRPKVVSMDGTRDGPVLAFEQTEPTGGSFIRIVVLPVPEGEKLEGREWKFGGKVEDPVVMVSRPDGKDPITVVGPDYTMTIRLTKQTRVSVEGEIDLTVKALDGTALKGPFRAVYRKSPTAPLDPGDAPYIHGKVVLTGARPTEKLAAGYVGVSADGKMYFNEVGYPINIGQEGSANAPGPEQPNQLSWLASSGNAITYRHLNVPPGDYLVYIRRDTIMSAWKRVKLKEVDQQAIDLTIDPAATGEVVVTLPASDAKGPGETSLALVPRSADLPELGLGSEHYFNVATVKMGETTIKLSGIPAGKYRAVRGSDEAEVEVVAGKSVSVTLMAAKK